MTPEDRTKAFARLHALMAHTVANGCTEDEEIAAARMAGRLAAELQPSEAPAETNVAQSLKAERSSADYQAALERNILEGLLKNAIQELAMAHINTISPPGRRLTASESQVLDARSLLNGHLSMALSVSNGNAARQILADTIEELIQDGMLPNRISVPVRR